ncbi:unnamed protein product, partial [Prorocentrum cordatum]
AKSSWKENESREVTLGSPLDRKVLVSNFRSGDGLRRVPKLMIKDSTGRRFMTLTEKDFKAIVANLPKIKVASHMLAEPVQKSRKAEA